MAFEKVLNHPDKNVIIRMLLQGRGVRYVSYFLMEKYPKNKELHITFKTLQAFRRDKLNIEGAALEAIKEAAEDKRVEREHVAKGKEKVKKKAKEKVKKAVAKENLVLKSPAYKEKIKEAISYHVDLQQELRELMVLIKSRAEDLFDRAKDGNLSINEEANLQRYFQAWTTTIERWAKYIEKIADRTIETNVNINVIEDQMALIREAIRETLSEFEPEIAIKFLDRLNTKMALLSYRPQKTTSPSMREIRTDVEVLTIAMQEGGDDD
jgi:hypothetical protein